MIDRTFPIPREVVAWFSGEMEKKLAENDHKPGWSQEYLKDLLERLHRDEVIELRKIIDNPALFPGSRPDNYDNAQLEEIIRESADIANFAMMIADLARGVLDERIEQASGS